jgi:hypothetical protein
VFWLSWPGIVEFSVQQVAPTCRPMGKFRYEGLWGRNVIRFRGRIGRRVLPVGTYEITARPLRNPGQELGRVKLVISRRGAPSFAARFANVCGGIGGTIDGTLGQALTTATGGFSGVGAGIAEDGKSAAGAVASAATGGRDEPDTIVEALGASAKKLSDPFTVAPLLLFGTLGLAILFFGLGAAPLELIPTTRAAALIAEHRIALAIGGAAALAGFSVLYLAQLL